MVLLDVFGKRVKPISTSLYPALPLFVILNIAIPPIKTTNRPDDLHTRPKTRIHDPSTEFLGRRRAVSRSDHRAM
jgi:hypothetical protein